MQRVMIIGCGGSGKSTLAQRISDRLGLENISLDQYYWKPGWETHSVEEWEKIVTKLAQKERWVMDGNYGGTMSLRIPRADTIIFLNYPRHICLARVVKRTLKHYGKVRPGMTADCPEHFNLEFLHYILMYNSVRRPGLLKKLAQLKDDKQVFILRNDQAVAKFLEQLNPQQ